MTDPQQASEAIAMAAAELIPQLAERLKRHGLGEIEISHGELRLRVAGGGDAAGPAAIATPVAAGASGASPAAGGAPAGSAERAGIAVASPAVGFFVYAEGLGPGLGVDKGDALGHVEMLGVRHDVRAPRRGTVRHLVAETGEAVEYGQVVVELDGVGAAR